MGNGMGVWMGVWKGVGMGVGMGVKCYEGGLDVVCGYAPTRVVAQSSPGRLEGLVLSVARRLELLRGLRVCGHLQVHLVRVEGGEVVQVVRHAARLSVA